MKGKFFFFQIKYAFYGRAPFEGRGSYPPPFFDHRIFIVRATGHVFVLCIHKLAKMTFKARQIWVNAFEWLPITLSIHMIQCKTVAEARAFRL